MLTDSLQLTLCGKSGDVAHLTAEDVDVLLDLSAVPAEEGTFTVPAEITVKSGKNIGVVGTHEVFLRLSEEADGGHA